MANISINPKERIGTVGFNRFGSKMIVDYYVNPLNIWVKFIETTEKPVHTTWHSFCKGKVRSLYDKTIFGIGYIGEGEYKVSVNRVYTHQYVVWSRMMQRCYSEKHLERNPTYIGCSVTEEWHNFQVFAKWYDNNYYEIEGEVMNLDKDILVKGNKIYSPETCVFAPKRINSLFIKKDANRGECPLGVYFDKVRKKYQASCINSKGKIIYIKQFDNSLEAFQAYKKFKENVIKEIAEEYKELIPYRLYEAMLKYQVEITD